MADIVNGKEVDYLHIQQTSNGLVIEYSEEFNIVSAHMSIIQKRLRENNIYCHVFKDLQHNLISIMFRNVKDIIPILHILNIPINAYEVMEDDCLIIVNTELL